MDEGMKSNAPEKIWGFSQFDDKDFVDENNIEYIRKDASIKKAYDEALERAKIAYKDEDRHLKATLERIFPELKDNEDEKNIKSLIDELKCSLRSANCQNEACGGGHEKRIALLEWAIAWLEKQGKPTEINPSEFDSQLNRLLKQFESLPKEELISSLSFYLNVIQNDGTYKEEKQGEQKSIMNVPSREVILSIWELGNDWKELTGGSISTVYGTQLDYIQNHWNESEYYLKAKQCEQKLTDNIKPKFKVKYAGGEYNVLKVKDINGVIYYGIEDELNHIDYVLPNNCEIISEQTPAVEMKSAEESLGIDSVTYNKIVDECIYGDNVKPKFKIGDWVVNKFGDVWHIDSFDSKNYQVSNGDKYCYFPIEKQNEMHLWTIQDAKDGDVLHSPTHNLIWIHKDIQYYHACVNMNYVKENFSTDGFIVTPTDVCPATKDKQTILFAKMKEDGYTFDFEKKELKEIHVIDEGKAEMDYCFTKMMNDEKVSSAWSEDDEAKLKSACALIRNTSLNGNEGIEDFTIDWLKSLKGRVRPKQEWSEEDEDYYDAIITKLEVTQDDAALTDNQMEFLKSLKGRVRPKQEWSKEDKVRIEQICDDLKCGLENFRSGKNVKGLHFEEIIKSNIDWLKSLKSKNTWKPSEDQMKALDNALSLAKNCGEDYSFDLRTLYEQLKKLKD